MVECSKVSDSFSWPRLTTEDTSALLTVRHSRGGHMLTKRRTHSMMHRLAQGVLALVFLLTGCTTLVNDPVRPGSAVAAHCSGAEAADNSPVALLPIPALLFFVPHDDLDDIHSLTLLL